MDGPIPPPPNGLHYNWHRSYDPTLGRYTQPDPLGFVDGPSVYGYAGGSPHRFVDRDGRNAGLICAPGGPFAVAACSVVIPIIVRQCIRWTAKELIQSISNNDVLQQSSNIDFDNPDTVKDRTVVEVRDALDKDPRYQGPSPSRDGNGDKYVKEGTRGADQVIINQGYPDGLRGGGGDTTHQGPYVKITSKGKLMRIPLKP